MLEGLEAVEINLIELETGIRIDAELYKKDLVVFEKRIKLIKHTLLGSEVKLIKKGIFDIKSDCYSEKGVPFVRISNLKNQVIDMSNIIYIPESENLKNLNTALVRNDIILSKTANAAASLVNIPFCNTSQDTVAIKLKDKSLVNSHFIVTYLNTKYGLQQMQRWFTGNIQMHLNLEDCKNNLLIPIYSITFQNTIKELFETAILKSSKSQTTYKTAETILLEEIGFKTFDLKNELVNIKSFKESFGVTKRLDAEYYQSKYEEIENKVKKNGFYTISEVFDLLSNPSPSNYTEIGTKVLKTKNIRIPTIEIEKLTDHTNEQRILIKKGDLLFASMGVGSLGRLSYIDKEYENFTTDGTLRIFRTKKEFRDLSLEIPCLLFLTSQFGQELIYKYVIGSTGIISISKENVENLIFPKTQKSVAKQLTDLVFESIKLKVESERLLEVAKKGVEMAIEIDEETATKFIKDNEI